MATTKKRWGRQRSFVVMLVLALFVAACGSSEEGVDTTESTGTDSTVPSDETTTSEADEPDENEGITFLGFYATEDIQPLLAAWEEYRPDIPLTYQEVPFGDLNSVIESRLGAGEALPDVYTVDQPRVADLVSRGYLLDITDSVGEVDEIFLPATIEATTIDGRLYALPTNTSSQVMYYNPDHLEAAGVELPSADPEERWTWEQTVEAATAAQDAGATWGILFNQPSRIYQLQSLAESAGGGSGLTGPDLLTPDFTNDGWVRAMEWWSSIHEDGVSPRGVPPGGETEQLFIGGEVTFFISGPWSLARLDDPERGMQFEYRVAPHPYFEGGEPATPTGSWAWGVNPNSENQEAAIEFLRFATENLEGSLALVESNPNMAANIESLRQYLSQETFQKDYDGVTMADILEYEAANTAVPRARSAGFIVYEELVGAALEDIRNGEPVVPTLEKLEADLEEALSR